MCFTGFSAFTATAEKSSYLFSERESFSAEGYSFRIIQEENREVKLISGSHETGLGLFDYSDKEVNLPSTVTYDGKEYTVTGISESVFELQPYGITLPNSIRFVLPSNFIRTEGFLNLGEGVEYIMDSSFHNGLYESIDLPKSLRILGSNCFRNNDFSTLNFSEGLLMIGGSSFCGNPKVEKLSLPASLEQIGDGSFNDNASLSSLELPVNITSATDCFSYNRALKRVEIKNRHYIPMFTDCFKEVDFAHCVLVIPDGCKEMYLTYMVQNPDNSLSNFRLLVEKSQEDSAVESIERSEIDTPESSATYTLTGLRTNENGQSKGKILIRRTSKGVEKILKP